MQVPWRIDVDFTQFPCAFLKVFASIYILLVLSCTLTDAGSMKVPWRFHAGCRELVVEVTHL